MHTKQSISPNDHLSDREVPICDKTSKQSYRYKSAIFTSELILLGKIIREPFHVKMIDILIISFIAKLLPVDDPARACVFEANLLEKEIELYFELLPSVRQFIRLTELKRRKQMDIEGDSQQDKPSGASSSIGRYFTTSFY